MNILEKYNVDLKSILLKLTDKNWKKFFTSSWILKKYSFSGTYWNQIQLKCPFHNDKSPSFGINKDLNRFNCFVCSDRKEKITKNWKEENIGKWSFFHFLHLFYHFHKNSKITDQEIIKLLMIPKEKEKQFLIDLNSKFKSGENNWIQKKYKSQIKLEKNPINDLKQYNKSKNSYLDERLKIHWDTSKNKILETKKFFMIWYDDEKNILTIPIFQDWFLRGIYGRKKIAKDWLRYLNVLTFPKMKIIFNYDEVLENKEKEVILVEWPLNAIKLWSLGYKNVISLFSAKAYPEQIEKLNKFEKIFAWFDNDEAWRNWIKLLKEKLNKKTFLYSVITDKNKDAFDYNKEEIKKILSSFSKIKR